VGTDAPCDFAEDWCAVAAEINAKLATYQQALARVYPAIPIALLRLTETVAAPVLVPIPFSEVVADTAGMTDMDADPTAITVQKAGRYVVRGWLRTEQSGILNNIINARIASDSTPPQFEINGFALDRAVISIGVSGYESIISVGAGAQIRLMQASLNTLNIIAASFCVAWHSDTERPS
jgi:hypothetical protein